MDKIIKTIISTLFSKKNRTINFTESRQPWIYVSYSDSFIPYINVRQIKLNKTGGIELYIGDKDEPISINRCLNGTEIHIYNALIKQKICPFCDLGQPLTTQYQLYVSFYLLENKISLNIDNVNGGDFSEQTIINFCPFCGRKLT